MSSNRMKAHAASTKPRIIKLIGTERVNALRDNPEQVHQLPYGSQSEHSLSANCPCSPTAMKGPQWWQRTYRHHLMDEGALTPTEDDDMELLRQANRNRDRRDDYR